MRTLLLLPVLLCLPAAAAPTAENYQPLAAAHSHEWVLDLPYSRYVYGTLHLQDGSRAADGVSLYLDTDHNPPLLHQRVHGAEFARMLPAGRHHLRLHSHDLDTAFHLDIRQEVPQGYQNGGSRQTTAPSPHLQALWQAWQHNPAQQAALLEGFWQDAAAWGGPLVEPVDARHSRVTFLWRGARHNVRLIGAPSADHEWLDRLGDTDIWFKSFTVPNDLRLSYRYAPDVPRLPPDADPAANRSKQRRALIGLVQADPLNPHRFGKQSLLVLPQAPEQTGSGQHPKQQLQVYDFHSPSLHNRRRIWIYQTAVVSAAEPIHLYLFDGFEYRSTPSAPAIADAVADKLNIPVVLVLIDHAAADSRNRELPPNPAFSRMLAQELRPFVEARTGLAQQPRRTVVAGSSYGGLAAAHAALQEPQVFGNVIALSGSFWWQGKGDNALYPAGLPAHVQQQRTPDIRWFISAGIYEGARNGEADILGTSQALHQALLRQQRASHFRSYSGGHDYAIWQGALADGLISLFGHQAK